MLACERKTNKRIDSDLSLKISLIKDYYIPYKEQLRYVPANDSVLLKLFEINLYVKNNSSKTLTFWTMTCDWEQSFLINNSYMSFYGHECDRNFPKFFTVKPNDSLKFKTTLARDVRFDNPCKNCIGRPSEWQNANTQLGLIVIDSTKCKNDDDYFTILGDKAQWNKIIWSNPLILNK